MSQTGLQVIPWLVRFITSLTLPLVPIMAQVEKPATPPEPPPQQNTGKPMLVSFACGEDDIRAAGLACTIDDPCPLFLELDSVETVGNRIFLAGDLHTATTTLATILLASDDSGKTWREPHERIRLSGLDRVQFVDFEHGWISGEALHPLPHDPFLLVTSDGGQSWRVQPVFADPQYGSIVQYAFTSPSNGSLVFDRGRGGEPTRYAMYETMNGGDTWAMRQSSDKPITLKRAGNGNNDWRLRADAATKAYRVEHRLVDGWHAVASFAVSIGVCKPSETPESQPAPSPTDHAGTATVPTHATPSTPA